MSSDSVITVENLSKRYMLGATRSKGDGLRHAIEGAARAPFRWASNVIRAKGQKKVSVKKGSEEFWALRDVNFSITRGEVVGIIGHNGAGKSTLLKLLSRITEPTRGRITVRGRVASLLEVGTGFHPELSGRENIYLNGAILGMSRVEIRQKFDEIIAFAEVERFLDTPVKRYSSGMYVRLAFAVAAHLEPEILIVDEVLAVGDSAFQKKCIGKMEEVAGQGRTVLFVSHNIPMVLNLCQRGILLKAGAVIQDGPMSDVVQTYSTETSSRSCLPIGERHDRGGSGKIIVTRIAFLDRNGNPRNHHSTGQHLTVRLHYQGREAGSRECRAGLSLARGGVIFTVLSTWTSSRDPLYFEGDGYVDFAIDKLPLTVGDYVIDCFLEASELYDVVYHAATISVTEGDYFKTGRVLPSPYWRDVGVLIEHKILHRVADYA